MGLHTLLLPPFRLGVPALGTLVLPLLLPGDRGPPDMTTGTTLTLLQEFKITH